MLRHEIPDAPPNFNPEKFFAGRTYFQKWEVFRGVVTPGHNDVKRIFKLMRVPEDLSGRRVLDLGAWNGCLSFECERRGAKEVVALSPEDPLRTGFEDLRRLVGARRTRYVRGTVYRLDPAELGQFDVVLFCGVLYHLRYPLLAIDNIRQVATRDVFVESYLSRFPGREAAPTWEFFPGKELAKDPSNWFGPNRQAVLDAFRSAGFDIEPTGKWANRGHFRARVRPGLPPYLAIDSCEARFYDTVLKPVLSSRFSGRVRQRQRLNSFLRDARFALKLTKEKVRAEIRRALS